MSDFMLFVAFPYVAMIVAVAGGIYRYYADRFSYSSQSSQFLENRTLFWGSVPWHYGIVLILLAHLLALLFPAPWTALMAAPIRLYVLEVTGMALALLAFVGLALLILRRLRNSRASVVTTLADWILLVVLLAQVILGFLEAYFYRWGSVWYVQTDVPWLISLLTLNPQVQYINALPLVARLHTLNGFIIFALFPFTRLVHLVTFPITYLWRPFQVAIWNRRARADNNESVL